LDIGYFWIEIVDELIREPSYLQTDNLNFDVLLVLSFEIKHFYI